MKLLPGFCVLLAAGLAGCGTSDKSPVVTTPAPASAQSVTGNWQIQSGGTVGSNTAGVLLLGDLVSSGANVTGTFRFSDLATGNACGALNQVITVTGKVDPTNPLVQSLTLTSSTFSGSVLTASLILPTTLQSFGTGTIQVTGPTCTFASSPAIGSLFPPVNGTFAGTLAPLGGTSGASGAATLLLAQATSPSADGQFAVTGSLQFTGTSCPISTTLNGNASGIGIRATGSPTAISLATLIATQPAPGLTQNLIVNLGIASPTCTGQLSTLYSGTLNKQ